MKRSAKILSGVLMVSLTSGMASADGGRKRATPANGKVARVNLRFDEPWTAKNAPFPAVPVPTAIHTFDRQSVPTIAEIVMPKYTAASTGSAKSVFSGGETLSPLKPVVLVPDPATKDTSVEPKKLKELSSSEEKLLEAQIVLEKHHNPETALGLLVELLDDKSVKDEAHFTYGLAAREIGLQSEFRATMMKVALETKNTALGRRATEQLANNVADLEISDVKVLNELVEKYDVETKGNDAYNFYRAKYFLEVGTLGPVEESLEQIPEKSKYRADALLIEGLTAYRTGKIDQAQARLETLIANFGKEESLRSIAAITLARIHFQKNEYKEASQAYLLVDKSNPLWLQAMVEQAWAQILTGDAEGAAGNMFSLHTDYFKNSFAPESYMARSVAYLNLCQFGDGLQTLENFKRKYGPLVGRLAKYQQEKKAPQDDYDTVRTWLKNTDLKEVNGLPRSFIVELAHHPSFMKTQNEINHFEDELERFNKANLALIQQEKDTLASQGSTRADVAKFKARLSEKNANTADLKSTIEGLEARLASLKEHYEFVKRARTALKDVRGRVVARIDKEKVVLKERASKALRARLGVLSSDLAQTLEQNEVMQYEVMAGAGEHLRAQSAGAEVAEKKPEAKTDGKSVKWSFKGEIWEDEIGHYRSSLKNVCSKEDKVAAQ